MKVPLSWKWQIRCKSTFAGCSLGFFLFSTCRKHIVAGHMNYIRSDSVNWTWNWFTVGKCSRREIPWSVFIGCCLWGFKHPLNTTVIQWIPVKITRFRKCRKGFKSSGFSPKIYSKGIKPFFKAFCPKLNLYRPKRYGKSLFGRAIGNSPDYWSTDLSASLFFWQLLIAIAFENSERSLHHDRSWRKTNELPLRPVQQTNTSPFWKHPLWCVESFSRNKT